MTYGRSWGRVRLWYLQLATAGELLRRALLTPRGTVAAQVVFYGLEFGVLIVRYGIAQGDKTGRRNDRRRLKGAARPPTDHERLGAACPQNNGRNQTWVASDQCACSLNDTQFIAFSIFFWV
jgi:hypothetical protein